MSLKEFVNIMYFINCNSITISTKVIDRSNQSSFFILSAENSSKTFPKHHRFATISETFDLNLIISTPLTNK